MFWFDDKVGDRTANRIDDHPDHLAATPVGTGGVGPDRELRGFWHGHLPSLLTLASRPLVTPTAADR
jgi:hypothetical protein